MENIRKFPDLASTDADTAGGKGAALGELLRANVPVPDGFVVLTSAFEQFLEESDLLAEIDTILHTVDKTKLHTIEYASGRIQELIREASLSESISKEIMQSFSELGSTYVAVRSSATAEDGADAAWAGQLESYLNVTEDSLIESVKQCWTSLFAPRALFYRFERALHVERISVAVVIQRMIESEVSGIAFSAHPVSGDRNQVVIEAGYGLGEAIVGGVVTPDTYVIEKTPRRIIETSVHSKEKALYRKEGGGNEWRALEGELAASQALSEQELSLLLSWCYELKSTLDFHAI